MEFKLTYQQFLILLGAKLCDYGERLKKYAIKFGEVKQWMKKIKILTNNLMMKKK